MIINVSHLRLVHLIKRMAKNSKTIFFVVQGMESLDNGSMQTLCITGLTLQSPKSANHPCVCPGTEVMLK